MTKRSAIHYLPVAVLRYFRYFGKGNVCLPCLRYGRHSSRCIFVLMRSNTVKLPTSNTVSRPVPFVRAVPAPRPFSIFSLSQPRINRVSRAHGGVSRRLYKLIAPSFWRVPSVNATHRSSFTSRFGKKFAPVPRNDSDFSRSKAVFFSSAGCECATDGNEERTFRVILLTNWLLIEDLIKTPREPSFQHFWITVS